MNFFFVFFSIYEDVERVLKSWNEKNIHVYVSIGSGEFLKKILSNTNRGSIVHVSIMIHEFLKSN